MLYLLDDLKRPIQVSLEEVIDDYDLFEQIKYPEKHRVGLTRVGEYIVSTIFLAEKVVHRGRWMYFKTEVFRPGRGVDEITSETPTVPGCEAYYDSWGLAEIGHDIAVQYVQLMAGEEVFYSLKKEEYQCAG